MITTSNTPELKGSPSKDDLLSQLLHTPALPSVLFDRSQLEPRDHRVRLTRHFGRLHCRGDLALLTATEANHVVQWVGGEIVEVVAQPPAIKFVSLYLFKGVNLSNGSVLPAKTVQTLPEAQAKELLAMPGMVANLLGKDTVARLLTAAEAKAVAGLDGRARDRMNRAMVLGEATTVLAAVSLAQAERAKADKAAEPVKVRLAYAYRTASGSIIQADQETELPRGEAMALARRRVPERDNDGNDNARGNEPVCEIL